MLSPILPDSQKNSTTQSAIALQSPGLVREQSGRINGFSDHALREKHAEEWQKSCVSESIILVNVRSVSGDAAVNLLTTEKISKMGGWAQQYATGRVIKTRKRYEHVKAGGWWVAGLDPLNGWAPMEWGQLKPETPRRKTKRQADGSYKQLDSHVKYEAPAGTETRAIFLAGAVDWAGIQQTPEMPVLITEGAKKAGAALTAGYAAVALSGVTNGYRVKDGLGNRVAPYLIPDIEAIAQIGRIIYLAFDQDERAETRRKVSVALLRFGRLLKERGCDVRVVQWDGSRGKGIDDLIAAHGADAFHSAVEQALTLDEFELWQLLEKRLTRTPAIALKTRDLTALQPESLPDSGIIAIASAKGTGKTKLIGGLIAGAEKALLAGHRISLMRNLCERCGVNYRGDLDKHRGRFIAGDAYTLRVGGCVDSLLAFNPADFRDCDLVLDEVVQVLRHLLTSKTCNKQGMRPVLLGRFRELIQAARRVIIADADLDDKTITYIQDLRGDGQRPFLVRNDYKADGYAASFIEASDASATIDRLMDDLRAGLKVYVATDSKRASKRVARLIGQLLPDVDYLLINSETSGGAVERGFMESPDQHLEQSALQVLIASPSAGTGLSIESEYFDKVYGLFYGGSITDADISQALGRVRAPIERVVWCAKYGSGFSKAGRETSALKLLNMLKQKTDTNTLLIRSGLSEVAADTIGRHDWAGDIHAHYWAEIEAERNRAMWSLRTALKTRLRYEGHRVEVIEAGSSSATKKLLKQAREEMKTEHCLKVESAQNLTPIEAKALESLDGGLDEAQRLALEKWQIAEFYALPVTEVTADLVLWDNSGRRRSQLLNLEGFLNPDEAIASDVRAVDRQLKWMGTVTVWDLRTSALKGAVRNELGLNDYLEPGREWTASELEKFKATALKYAAQIKAALNFTVQPDMAAAQILNQLLEQIGVETASRQHRVSGERRRTYRVNDGAMQLCREVLQRRKDRRDRLSESVTPLPTNKNKLTGCDRQTPPITNDSGGASAAPAALAGQVGLLPASLADDFYDSGAWRGTA